MAIFSLYFSLKKYYPFWHRTKIVFHSPKQCGHTEGVLTVSQSRWWCSIEVVPVASGIFPINFRTKCLLWPVHVHFDCAGAHKMAVAGYAYGIFFLLKFPRDMPLVTCPCAFRLRRLAQPAYPGMRVRHAPCKFPHNMPLVTCPCAFRLGSYIFPSILAFVTCPRVLRAFECQETFLRELAQRSCQDTFDGDDGDLAQDLFKRSVRRELL